MKTKELYNKLIAESNSELAGDFKTKLKLPNLIDEYIKKCGNSVASHEGLEVTWENTIHRSNLKDSFRNLDYTLFLSTNKIRLAYIDAKIIKILEGWKRKFGIWDMKLFNLLNIINISNEVHINTTALSTYLSEFSVLPKCFMSHETEYSEMENRMVLVKLKVENTSVEGIFYFNDQGLIDKFETNDRFYSEDGKKFVKRKWIGKINDYKKINGRLFPAQFQAFWDEISDGNKYFQSDIKSVTEFHPTSL
ncbi:MAG: hypothetical protein A2355_05325 [Spirochaetes bacterium RIFOXYB1_FULL_32_8]|nr:MAG: hypothetical protein A2Y29_08940 [Spirochaetes bacterium GWE2_31_10]OHD81872.1 MAG: hypothetical protein A2355_05325 [Spirochaetes bacterium RIFOXYB1_FULL_32_8]HBD94643.1 hypothetical protein [Spirochaetia bacterium]HBI39241.1 hypothetical protein [Spirochaetia bacterium]